MKHPLYGEIIVPDKQGEINADLEITRIILKEGYNSVILAYQDMLEEALDMYRRKGNV